MFAFNINFGKQDHVVTAVRGNFNTQEQNVRGNFNKQEQYVRGNKKSPTSSTSYDGRIINTNSGKQGDLISSVAGDVIQHVGGNVFKGVGRDVINVYGDYISGEEKIGLPKFVVLKSKYEGRCLRLTENDGSLPTGFLKFEGSEVATEEAKFELVPSKSGKELVHLRCCYNNKYLVRYTGALGTTCSSRWIVAAADKREEDKFKISCTLFKLEPVNIEGLEFRFFHIQLEKHACLWTCSKPSQIRYFGGLHGDSGAPDKDVFNVYTVVAWESLEMKINKKELPRFVALKSMYNNKYLSLTKNDPLLPTGYLKFDGEEVVTPLVKFEVEMAKIGNRYVHIRCCDNKKYLVRQNTPIGTCCYSNRHWIVAAADKPEEDKYKISCTLFEPELYDGSGGLEFRFRHVQLGSYACLWRMKNHIPFYGGLYAGSNAPDKDACDVFILRE